MRRQPRRAYVHCVIATLAASFAATGQETPLGDAFQVNSYTTESQYDPQVAVDGDGDFVVVWESPYDGADNGIFAQRFGALESGIPLDVDGNGQTQALSDGLLVLRYLFGLTGSTLVQGAVAGNCTRCDETTIGPYLVGLDG